MASAMLSRSVGKVYATAQPPKAARASRVVPKASLNDAPKQFIETGAEAPMPTAGLPGMTTTPFDSYKFAPIREATVSIVLWLYCMQQHELYAGCVTCLPATRCVHLLLLIN